MSVLQSDGRGLISLKTTKDVDWEFFSPIKIERPVKKNIELWLKNEIKRRGLEQPSPKTLF